MSAEADFISSLRSVATDPAARALFDDAAVLEVGGRTLVITKDMLVEGVHYRPDDPPEDVAWKLVAVNLSDLAAKGARPRAALLGYMLGQQEWDRLFADGLSRALAAFSLPLIGGDTVSSGTGRRVLSLTAIGEASGAVPSRAAAAGDHLWVSGTIGDGGAGLAMLSGEFPPADALVRRYRAPRPRLEAGAALAPLVSAMMDVSDGLLIDAARMGHASGVGVTVELDQLPLSADFIQAVGSERAARLRAATAGDDYELLFAAPAKASARIVQLGERLGLPLTRVGRCEPGAGLQVMDAAGPVQLPDRLGWEHGGG